MRFCTFGQTSLESISECPYAITIPPGNLRKSSRAPQAVLFSNFQGEEKGATDDQTTCTRHHPAPSHPRPSPLYEIGERMEVRSSFPPSPKSEREQEVRSYVEDPVCRRPRTAEPVGERRESGTKESAFQISIFEFRIWCQGGPDVQKNP